MDQQNGLFLQDENAHLKQSIRDILNTPIGTRLQRRDYGSLISLLIDQPISHGLFLQIASSAIMALKQWEPRLQLYRFKVNLSAEGNIVADLIGQRNDRNQTINIDYSNLKLGNKSS